MKNNRKKQTTETLELPSTTYTVQMFFIDDMSHYQPESMSAPILPIELDHSTSSKLGLILVIHEGNTCRTAVITGIPKKCHLYSSTAQGSEQTVLIVEEDLILCIGDWFCSINLTDLSWNWKIQPDSMNLFEFYTLADDFLLRGELQIYRIDKNGQIIWSYGGKDIWLNMDGIPEIEIKEDTIHLADFSTNRYIIDWDGQTLSPTKASQPNQFSVLQRIQSYFKNK